MKKLFVVLLTLFLAVSISFTITGCDDVPPGEDVYEDVPPGKEVYERKDM